MKLRFDRNATALAAAILLAYGAATDAADTRSADAPTRSAAPSAGSATATEGPASAASVRDLRMSDLLGMDVRNPRGENLGDLKDVVIDLENGRIMYAVVGIGGVLGIGEKLSAFPMNAFKVSQASPAGGTSRPMADNDGVKGDKGPIGSDRTPAERAAQGKAGPIDNDGVKGDKGPIGSDRATGGNGGAGATASRMLSGRGTGGMHLVLSADPQRLKQAPNFDKDAWPDWNDAKYRGSVDRAGGGSVASKAGHLVRASQLQGADIQDAQKKNVGEIEDLVVDMRNGQVHYAVVDFDQAWTPVDKLVAVPLKALRPAGNKGDLMFSGDRSRLERAPSFDKGKWPDLNSARYHSDMDRYLSSWGGNVAPGTGMSGTPTDRSRGSTAAGTGGAATGSPGGASGSTTR